MARRRRKKPKARRQPATPKAPGKRDHMARVHVTDIVWTEFRAAAGPVPLNLYLGELVEREVERYRSRRVREGRLHNREVVEALDRARELHADLAAIMARLESRLDQAGAGRSDLSGSEWGDEAELEG